jgi:Tol biopolymer transport system component
LRVLSDEQFIEQLRADVHAGMEVLRPSQELLEAIEALNSENGRLPHGSVERPAGRDQRGWRGRVRGLGAAVPVLAAVVVVVVVGVAALTSLRPRHGSTPAGAGIAAKTGQIALVGGPFHNLEFVNPDGSGLRDVGAIPDRAGCDELAYGSAAGCFAWSRNGKELAYLAGGAHEYALYLLGADGRHPRRLTACGDCQGVSWSPDGSQIAVGRYVAGQPNVWVVNAKSGVMRRITGCQLKRACGAAGFVYVNVDGFQLQWSPDGRKIFFIRFGYLGGGGTGTTSLDTVRPDGSDLWELPVPARESPSAPSPPVAAQWSPDGRELAVDTYNGVWIIDAAGTVTRLTRVPATGGSAWSPDGRELAIAAPDGIYTVDADGMALTRLAAAADLSLWAPAWSPNGKQLAYGSSTFQYQSRSHQTHVEGVWTINADGSDRRLIYETIPLLWGSVVDAPIWSSDGSQLAFSSYDGTYVADADGSHRHRIGQGTWPPFAWQPIPSTR